MIIMNTRLIGIANSNPTFVKDTNGDGIRCRFTMFVRESGQKIRFTVFVDDKILVEKCKTDLTRGAVIIVEGNMFFRFNNLTEEKIPDYIDYPPAIKTDMILECSNLHVLYGKIQRERDKAYINLLSISKGNETIPAFQADEELPF